MFAFICKRLLLGGAEKVSQRVGAHLSSKGYRVRYFTLEHIQEEWSKPESELVSVDILPDGTSEFSRANVAYMKQVVAQEQIKVLFITLIGQSVVKEIFNIEGCKVYVWHHGQPFWERINKVEKSQVRRRRNVLYALEWYLHSYIKYELLPYYKRKLEDKYRHHIQVADGFITLCPAYKAELSESLGLSLSEQSKIYPIINTLDIEEAPQLNKEKLIVWVGRLILPHKRPDRMLDIWERVQALLPDWRVEIWGSGKEYKALAKAIDKRKLERISLKGYIDNPDVVYRSASVLCMTSTFEGWGLVLAEAQNNGTVPMAFDCSRGVQTLIGDAGILVQPFDVDEYAERLVGLCQSSDLLRAYQEKCLLKRLDYRDEVNDAVWEQIVADITY